MLQLLNTELFKSVFTLVCKFIFPQKQNLPGNNYKFRYYVSQNDHAQKKRDMKSSKSFIIYQESITRKRTHACMIYNAQNQDTQRAILFSLKKKSYI